MIGCRYVTLDAERHLVGWYQGQGFVPNLEEQASREALAREQERDPESLPQSMRFDLRDLREG